MGPPRNKLTTTTTTNLAKFAAKLTMVAGYGVESIDAILELFVSSVIMHHN
jgi:hypothetical protein